MAHKLRRFDLNIKVGQSEEIHPSKFYKNEETGLITKNNFRNAISKSAIINKDIRPKDVIVTTSQAIDGHQVIKYLGIIFEEINLRADEVFDNDTDQDFSSELQNDPEIAPLIQKIHELEKQFSKKQNNSGALTTIYKGLTEKLQQNAIVKGGNAIIGVNYQLTHEDNKLRNKNKVYKLVSSGTVVVLEKIIT